MARYILRYGAQSSAPVEHLQAIRSTPGVQVLDESPRMLLVDGEESALRVRLKGMPGWSLHKEESIPLPDARKKLD